jgi:surface protein
MKNLNTYISEKLKIKKNSNNNKIVNNLDELIDEIDLRLDKCKHDRIINLDLSGIDVSDVKRLNDLFLPNLRNRDSVKFNLLKRKIKTINVSNWDVSNCTDLSATFYGLINLEEIIGIEDWDISNVINMWATFSYCKNLKLNLEKWDISDLCTTNLITEKAPFVKIPCLGI